ncbi:MAG: hypothetical protein QM765_38855 [Myxococcales bacterium]
MAFGLAFTKSPGFRIAQCEIAVKSRTFNPILDLVVQNDRKTGTVVDRLGLKPLRIWTDLKGLPRAQKLKRLGRYRFELADLRESEEQWMDLPDPLFIPPGAACRFELQPLDFRRRLRGNECILELLAGSQDSAISSGAIYFGVY